MNLHKRPKYIVRVLLWNQKLWNSVPVKFRRRSINSLDEFKRDLKVQVLYDSCFLRLSFIVIHSQSYYSNHIYVMRYF